MTTQLDPLDERMLLDATRRALVAVSDGLDVSAVEPETPLAALVFDSLMAVKFIATLESVLEVNDLPFERWLAEHSERTDALTIGSLVEWLASTPQVGSDQGGAARAEASRGRSAGDG